MSDVMANRRIVFLGLIASSTLLVWGTAFDGRSFGPIRAVLVALPHGDKVGHLGLYGAIALAAGLLVRTKVHVAATGLVVILLGVADEFRQLSEGNRNFSAGDVLANLAGICLGLLVASMLRRMNAARETSPNSELYIL